MENAAKALIMAASVLIGMMIISLAVMIFNALTAPATSYGDAMDAIEVAQFNIVFERLVGRAPVGADIERLRLEGITPQEILTVRNFAVANGDRVGAITVNVQPPLGSNIPINIACPDNAPSDSRFLQVAMRRSREAVSPPSPEEIRYRVSNVERRAIDGKVISITFQEFRISID
ncbi:MAG: hypothetical protein FWC79_05870 [Oscillospiraceae bacterium]|nr:hypothetical protein [Oscillospiraceae bacterium]